VIIRRSETYQAELKAAFERGKLEGQAGKRNEYASLFMAESARYADYRASLRYRLRADCFIPAFIEHASKLIEVLQQWEKLPPNTREVQALKKSVKEFMLLCENTEEGGHPRLPVPETKEPSQ
jgi:hypothetical protein